MSFLRAFVVITLVPHQSDEFFTEKRWLDAFSSGSGAGSIKVDDIITGLKTFRDTMYIFCENSVLQLIVLRVEL